MRLLTSTTSAGSINTVLPEALSSWTIPESLRLCIGATGITRRPSRMVGGGIGIDYAVGGCPRHYSPHHGIDGTRHALEPVANVGKERACVIAYLSIAVENTVEHGGYGRKGGEALRYQIKAGIGRLA